MTALKFDKFGGQIPAFDDRLLPDTNSAYCQDGYLQAGRLEPLAADIEIHEMTNPAARYAFRVPKANPDIDNMADSYWVEFDDANTTGVRSPVTDTAEGGIYYFANGGHAPQYTTKARLQAGNYTLLTLGIPRPTVAPGVVPSGGAAPTVTRAYVYTWVSIYGEEGQPSPPTLATGNTGATWAITLTPPTTLDETDRLLDRVRIYRTETGIDGVADFFFVAELPKATTVFNDTTDPDIVASSEIMKSTDWSGPPVDLKGLCSLPNGMIAGWRENQVWYCEPYRPHAWPTKYVINVESPIVGLGSIDQNLMVLTKGQPYVAMGIHPSTIALRQVQPLEPCTSQGSITATPNGVLYTSNNGLILIGPGGGVNLTFDIIRKDDWLKLTNLTTIHGTYFMNGYYAFAGVVENVFQTDAFQMDGPQAFQDDNFFGTQDGFHISLSDSRLGFMTVTSDSPTYNVLTDLWTGELMVIRNGRVYHVDRRMYSPRRPYLWRSKIIETNWDENFAAVKISFDQPFGPPAGETLFRYYANGKLRFTRPVVKSGQQFRLPSGFRTEFVQFELAGELMIFNMEVATSARELRET